MGVNKVILVGNLGKDPEVRTLENGTKVANFSLATSETYNDRNSGERKTVTEWHNIVTWRQLAEIAEKYLIKGKQIYIEGKIKTRKWEDQNGNTRYTTEIVADSLQMLGSRDSQTSETNNISEQPKSQSAPSDISSKGELGEDDLPF